MKQKILLGLFIISLIASSILAFTPIEEVCGIESSGCSIIHYSSYDKTLGINNSYFGVLGFSILIILTLLNMNQQNKNRELLIKIFVIFSSIIAIYFIYLQVFIIKAFCKYCLVVDSSSIISLGVLYLYKK